MSLNLAAFAGDWDYRVNQFTGGPTSPQLVLKADPRRWAIQASMNGASATLLPGKLNNLTPFGFGFPFSPTAPTQVTYHDWGALLGGEWYVFDANIGDQIILLEAIILG